MRVLDGPLTAAAALKMSYAGITKGFTALGAAMMLAATRAGSAEALTAELAESRPDLLDYLSRQVPAMYSKAYRWVAELEEISAFVGEDRPEHAMLEAAARLYERIAADVERREKGKPGVVERSFSKKNHERTTYFGRAASPAIASSPSTGPTGSMLLMTSCIGLCRRR